MLINFLLYFILSLEKLMRVNDYFLNEMFPTPLIPNLDLFRLSMQLLLIVRLPVELPSSIFSLYISYIGSLHS